MTRYQTIGAIIAFVLFQVIGREYFPNPLGPEFSLSWEQMIAVVVATFAGAGIGHVVGKIVEPYRIDG